MVIDAITNKLDELFGDSAEYITDNVVIDLNPPCFMVKMLESSSIDYIGGRKGIKRTFLLTYVSDKDRASGRQLDLNNVSDRLLLEFDFLTDPYNPNDIYRPYEKNIERTEGELHFTFNIFETYRKVIDAPKMNKLTQTWRCK